MSLIRHRQRMRRVVAYIEAHLDEAVDVEHLAGIACYSSFHFHRLFRSFVGESVHAYKKRLLLERAVKQLCHTAESITAIAFDCGYDNQSSFNKAFRGQYGVTPGQVRRDKVLPSPEGAFSTLIQDIDMTAQPTPDLVTLDDIPVIYARGTGPYAEAAADAWGRIMSFAYGNRLMDKSVRSFGISHDDPQVTAPEQLRYDACLDIQAALPPGSELATKVIAGGKYARFLHQGPYEEFPRTYAMIFHHWLPSTDYRLREEPCFERYLNRDPRRTKPENLRTEIYIPIN